MLQLVKTEDMNDFQKDQFVSGWEEAGGYMGDIEYGSPWCCPWRWTDEICVEGETPHEWGVYFWEQFKDEVERMLGYENIENEQEEI